METTRIPAGIVDINIEFFLNGDAIEFIKGGTRQPFENMDVADLAIIRAEIDSNPAALRALEEMEIFDPVQQIKQWIRCNMGDFDSRADLTPDGIVIREYFDCGQRGTCPHEGRLCTLPAGVNGQLTPREIEVIKLIGRDLADKEIADRLGISVNTVHIHRGHIEHKIGAKSKVGIAVFGRIHNII
jgi:DNA-binding CsgD family transcriptional regulator